VSYFEDAAAVAAAVVDRRVSETGWVRTNCPVCWRRAGTPDTHAALRYNVGSLRFNCFRCGFSGRLKNSPDEYALEHDALSSAEPAERVYGVEQPEGFVDFPEHVHPDDIPPAVFPGFDYLTRIRGLSRDVIDDYGIGACWGGRFSQRIVMPVFGSDGSWLWFSARSWFKKHPIPYLYPKGDRLGIMFGHAAIFAETRTPLLVLEGGFDAIAHSPDAVGALGKPSEATHIALMCARRPVVFVLDGDAHLDGWVWAMRLRAEGREAGSVRLPPGVDPDVYSHPFLLELARKSLADGECIAPPPDLA